MKTAFIITCFLFLSIQSFGQMAEADRYFPIEKSHSYIEFSVKYMGYAKVKGRFADFDGMIYYDDKDISKMSATLVVKVESIDTDLEFRDNDLKSDGWFDAKQFPLITFKSKRSVATPSGFDVIGDVTIKGITKEITVHMNKPSGVLKDVRSDAQVILTGTTSIKRTEFGVEGKRWSGVKEGITAVEDNVDLGFSLLAKQIKKENFKNWVSNLEKPPGKLYSIANEKGPKAAIEEFSKMRKENAVQAHALNVAAYMLQLEDRVDDAIQLLEANRAEFPADLETSQELGYAYLRKGNRDKAKQVFNSADANDPTVSETLKHL